MWGIQGIDVGLRLRAGRQQWECMLAGEDLLWRVAEAEPVEQPQAAATACDPAEDSWQRWNRNGVLTQVFLQPALPDKAVVLRPREELTLAPRSTFRCYVAVPPFVRLYAGPDTQAPLVWDQPSQPLSKTWFGADPTQGELAYAWRGDLPRQAAECPPGSCIWAPLTLTNRSTEPMLVTRVILRCPYLACWRDAVGQLWTNEVTTVIEEQGRPVPDLRIGSGAPAACRAGVEVCPARSHPSMLQRLPALIARRLR